MTGLGCSRTESLFLGSSSQDKSAGSRESRALSSDDQGQAEEPPARLG